MRFAFTIGEEHVGRATVVVDGRRYATSNFMGRILPGDVGKRVFETGGILQVENDGQRDARRERERPARPTASPGQLEDPVAVVALCLQAIAQHVELAALPRHVAVAEDGTATATFTFRNGTRGFLTVHA